MHGHHRCSCKISRNFEFQKGHWSNAQFDDTDISSGLNLLEDLNELIEESQTTTAAVVQATTVADVDNVTTASESAAGILLRSIAISWDQKIF